MTDLAQYTATAPAFTVAGRTVADMGRDLVRLDVREGAMGLRTLVARLMAVGEDSDGSAGSLRYLDGQDVDLGSAITATIGPSGDARQVFNGTVSALELTMTEGGYPVVTICAEDALMRLRMASRSATWSDVSDADLVSRIADLHGLGAQVDLDGPTHPVVQQQAESDLAFLRRRLSRIAGELWVDADDVVHAADRTARPGPTIGLVQGNDLIAVTARVDLAHQRSSVVVRGWDRRAVEVVAEEAGADVISAETTQGRTGPALVADVFGQVALARVDRGAGDSALAQALADAEMRRRARGFVTVDGTTAGTPDMVPGAHLILHRVGRPFAGGGYRVVAVHHSYDLAVGHRTDFTAERAEVTA